MQEQTIPYNDFAIILTWPDATIRGDEKWMMFFKKIGIVKNLNFKVGHTGVVIVDHRNGNMLFYDFGRYIAPRGYGRARSQFSDPLLEIKIKAKFSSRKIGNLPEILEHFEGLKTAMYGEGKLLLSIVDRINFSMARAYGDQCVMQGTYPYGAVARNNNNCSRFITRMLIKSSQRFHFWHMINLPETIKCSPVSNLVNTVSDRMIYSYTPEDGLAHFRMNRFQSFWFLVKQLGDNVFKSKADLLPTDQIIGAVNYRSKPITVPKDAMYLGGVGDGAWYTVCPGENKQFTIKRFTTSGKLEYVVLGEAEDSFDPTEAFEITYDSNLLFTHILQRGNKLRIKHLQQLELKEYTYKHIQERYA
ncbi:DUF6695 family protein [Sphingobacterium faecale]|uniref:Uncharacterized protein n=1 Tax=Sphingobacterium faecale TaxID=2803775 RepID=A0ABS1R4I9_9SPHI|nr:DUF6695 family protein [Sphingobacterium faecale]MBL1409626.1 hypothetical protein [Sphingobacterium faecale]